MVIITATVYKRTTVGFITSLNKELIAHELPEKFLKYAHAYTRTHTVVLISFFSGST